MHPTWIKRLTFVLHFFICYRVTVGIDLWAVHQWLLVLHIVRIVRSEWIDCRGACLLVIVSKMKLLQMIRA